MAGGQHEAFSYVDSAWLNMDEPTNLMMITGVLMFEGPLDLERFRAVLEQRLLRFARFRMRLERPHQRGGTHRWVPDPHFSMSSHLHRVALPAPGGQEALQALVSDLMSTPLDYSKPLWQFHIVEDPSGGSALIARLHHAIADGIALVQVLLSLTDDAPRGDEETPDPAPRAHGQPAGKPREALLAPVSAAIDAAIRGGPDTLIEAAQVGGRGLVALNKLLFMEPDPPTLFKGPLGAEKRAAWSQPIALEDVKAVGRMARGTVNDVLINAVAGALRRYLLGSGIEADGLNLRAVVPVNLRPLDQPITELGNKFGVVFLALPVGIADPFDRLLELKRRMEAIKHSPEAVVAFGILNLIGATPPPLADVAVDLFGSKATAVMTNVPGPRQPIYLAGARIDKTMFWVPQSGHLGLGVSIFSYAGAVLLGVATDARLVPDPQAIVTAFQAELEALVNLARLVEGGSTA